MKYDRRGHPAFALPGVIPANVNYTGKASVPFGDAPIYDPATRTLTWNACDIPAWPGVTSQAISAAFEVSLTPTADEIGTYPPLMTGQQIAGTTRRPASRYPAPAADLNSHLTTDPQAAATGPVK